MAVARFVNGTARTFADWVKLFKQQPNELPTRDQAMFQKVGGDPNIHYVHGYWRLAPDEALVVETECRAARSGTSSSTTTGWSRWTTVTCRRT